MTYRFVVANFKNDPVFSWSLHDMIIGIMCKSCRMDFNSACPQKSGESSDWKWGPFKTIRWVIFSKDFSKSSSNSTSTEATLACSTTHGWGVIKDGPVASDAWQFVNPLPGNDGSMVYNPWQSMTPVPASQCKGYYLSSLSIDQFCCVLVILPGFQC